MARMISQVVVACAGREKTYNPNPDQAVSLDNGRVVIAPDQIEFNGEECHLLTVWENGEVAHVVRARSLGLLDDFCPEVRFHFTRSDGRFVGVYVKWELVKGCAGCKVKNRDSAKFCSDCGREFIFRSQK